MKHSLRLRAIALAVAFMAALATGAPPALAQASAGNAGAAAGPLDHPIGQTSTAFLPMKDVRIGQRGYGMTVFRGVEIEPFPVEVVSIQYDNRPQLGVIWVVCRDERLEVSGPVQGMSGSPIYLWDEDEPEVLGEGGRLIGAFAYGYSMSKECLAGVQPIEQMLEITRRVPVAGPEGAESAVPDAGQAGNRRAALRGGVADGAELIGRMIDAWPVQRPETDRALLARARAIQALLDHGSTHPDLFDDPGAGSWSADGVWTDLLAQARETGPAGSERRQAPGPFGASAGVTRLAMPIDFGQPEAAALARPFIEPLGFAATASGIGGIAGRPPNQVDPRGIALTAGGVVGVPMIWGDLNLGGIGTVTDVLKDGRILLLGHSMDGQGPTSMPMANGFVHAIVPLITTSFKMAGSGEIVGSLVRDEVAGVVGQAGVETFSAAPGRVTVRMPDHPERVYDYQVLRHEELMPVLAAVATLQSIGAVQAPPIESTMRMTATARFDGGQQLTFDTRMPGAGPVAAALALLPAFTAMASNPWEPMLLEDLDVQVSVTPELNVVNMVDVRVDRAVVAPGESLGVTLYLQPRHEPRIARRLKIDIPEDMADGEYGVILCSSDEYLGLMRAGRPHLNRPENAQGLVKMLQRVLDTPENQIYMLMQTGREGLAIGSHEMSLLPSSRRAMLNTGLTSRHTLYQDWIEARFPSEQVVQGARAFSVTVRTPGRDPSKP